MIPAVAKRRKRVLALYDAWHTQHEIAAKLGMPASTVAYDLRMSPGYVVRPPEERLLRPTVAKRRKRVRALYDAGLTQLEIAAKLAMPGSVVALDLKMSPGYVPRSSAPVGRISAWAASQKFGLDPTTLGAAIDAGRVRGQAVIVSGKRTCRTVVAAELEQDLANLPRCVFEGCDKPALAPGGGCSGPHGAARVNRGKPKSAETRGKMAAAKRGRPRPDVRERVAAMHADPETHYSWGVRLAEGRQLPPNSQRRWKGRLGGLEAARTKGAGRRRTELAAEIVAEVRRLTLQGFGREPIASKLGISVRQVRNARLL